MENLRFGGERSREEGHDNVHGCHHQVPGEEDGTVSKNVLIANSLRHVCREKAIEVRGDGFLGDMSALERVNAKNTFIIGAFPGTLRRRGRRIFLDRIFNGQNVKLVLQLRDSRLKGLDLVVVLLVVML